MIAELNVITSEWKKYYNLHLSKLLKHKYGVNTEVNHGISVATGGNNLKDHHCSGSNSLPQIRKGWF